MKLDSTTCHACRIYRTSHKHGYIFTTVCFFAVLVSLTDTLMWYHDAIVKWKHFPRYWPFVRGLHRSPVNSPHKGQWRKTLMFSLICAWIDNWVYNHGAGDLRRHRAHHDVIIMLYAKVASSVFPFFQKLRLDLHSLCSNCPVTTIMLLWQRWNMNMIFNE